MFNARRILFALVALGAVGVAAPASGTMIGAVECYVFGCSDSCDPQSLECKSWEKCENGSCSATTDNKVCQTS